MGRKKKDIILHGGLNWSQMCRDPFSFQYGYDYYEDSIMSMNCYFEGFNLRQLNSITFSFNQFALAYQSYMQLLDNKERDGRCNDVTEDEKTALESFKRTYALIREINGVMRQFHNTSNPKYSNQLDNFGDHYDKQMSGRCWVRPDEELRKMQYRRFITEQGKRYGVGKTETYKESNKHHISGLNQNIDTLYSRGYWLEYLKISCIENAFEANTELNNWNPFVLDKLFKEALTLMDDLNKLNYFTGLDDFNIEAKHKVSSL
jgi:hypothetical protein